MRYCAECGNLFDINLICTKCRKEVNLKKKFKTGPYYKTLYDLKKFPSYKRKKVVDLTKISFLEPGKVGDIERDLVFATNYNDMSNLDFCPIRISLELKQKFQYKDHQIDWDPNKERAPQYARFCNATGLKGIAYHIKNCCGKNVDDEEVINAVLSFVHHKNIPASLHYIEEKGDFEFPKFPIETLFDGGGDCEDLAILFASLTTILGYETVLILVFGYKPEDDHMYVGVYLPKTPSHFKDLNYHYQEHNGKKYYTCECTWVGWVLGENPEEGYNYQYREIANVAL